MLNATIDQYFAQKAPQMRPIYDCLMRSIGAFGPMRVAVHKNAVQLERYTDFAIIRPRKNHLYLAFRTRRRITSPRIAMHQQLSFRLHDHAIRIESEGDIDEELLGWLKAAYDLSG